MSWKLLAGTCQICNIIIWQLPFATFVEPLVTGCFSHLHLLVDANYAGCLDTRRSTTGWCRYFGNSLISGQWKTRSGLHIFNGGWISSHVFRMLWNHLVDFSKRSLLYSVLEDNKNAIQIALNLVYHECTKYNDVVCHFISGKALIKSFYFFSCFIISLNYEHPY